MAAPGEGAGGPGTRGPGGPGSPLIFRPNWGPKGTETNFLETAWPPSPPAPPAYLKVWIRHCLDDGNQSEKTDECSENVNIPSVLFLSPSNKDNTKEDLFRVVNTCWERMTLVFTWKNVKTLAWRSKIYISRVSQKQDNKSLKTAGKNTRIKWMPKFVIYKSVFLPGWFESKWPGKRLSVIINSECKKKCLWCVLWVGFWQLHFNTHPVHKKEFSDLDSYRVYHLI